MSVRKRAADVEIEERRCSVYVCPTCSSHPPRTLTARGCLPPSPTVRLWTNIIDTRKKTHTISLPRSDVACLIHVWCRDHLVEHVRQNVSFRNVILWRLCCQQIRKSWTFFHSLKPMLCICCVARSISIWYCLSHNAIMRRTYTYTQQTCSSSRSGPSTMPATTSVCVCVFVCVYVCCSSVCARLCILMVLVCSGGAQCKLLLKQG